MRTSVFWKNDLEYIFIGVLMIISLKNEIL